MLLGVYAIQSGGEPGARLLKAEGRSVSPDTLLRLAKAMMTPQVAVPEILGVDDFAFCRVQTYGTLAACQRKGSDAPPVRLGGIVILDGTPRLSFFGFQACVEVCFTEVSPGLVGLIEFRMVEQGSLQVCSA